MNRLVFGIARFIKYCHRCGITPDCVDDTTFISFRDELTKRSLHPHPGAAYRQAVKLWNCALEKVPDWPNQAIASSSDARKYALPWDTFEKSFLDDLESFLSTREVGDEFAEDYTRRVRPATTKSRRETIRRIASILVLQGVAAKEITSLSVLCGDQHAIMVLKFLRGRRADQKLTVNDLGYAQIIKTIARHWARDEVAARKLTDWIAKLTPESGAGRTGMTSKNRRRLQQVDDGSNVLALLDLPDKVFQRVRRLSEPRNIDCIKMMYAAIIAIELCAPLRAKNVTELELGSNIVEVGKDKNRVIRIYLYGRQTKNGEEYEAPLPSRITQ